MSRAEHRQARADEIIEELAAERRAGLAAVVELIAGRPDIPPRIWLDALALHFGPDALQVAPSGEAAERLVVDAYWRWMARAKDPAGRNGGGRFAGDPDFNQKTFLEQFGHYLVEGDRADVHRKAVLQNWTEQESATAKKALQRLLKKYPRDGI